jgi:dTDP-4-amino-4,6-dideoxygalactose transaminase
LASQAKDDAPHYQHSQIGYNYIMSNICAAIGRGQLQVLNDRVRRRRLIYDYYFNELTTSEGVSFLSEPEGFFSNRWLTCILIDPIKTKGVNRNDIRIALVEEDIVAKPVWKPLHQQPVFTKYPVYSNSLSDRVFDMGLCLPSSSHLTQRELTKVVDIIKRRLRQPYTISMNKS